MMRMSGFRSIPRLSIDTFAAIVMLIVLLPTSLYAEQFKIGIVIPLTGPVAPFGVALKNAIQLVQSENQDTTNETIQFIYEDSAYDGKVALSAFNKLVQSDKVDLVYVWGTSPAVVVAPIAEKNKVPLITLSGEETVVANREYVIDFDGRISDYSRATIEYARSKGYKNIAVVNIETQYIETLLKGMKEHKAAGENIEVLASFSPDGAPDFNTILKIIQVATQSKKFDSLAVFLGTGQISLFYQKMAQFKISIPTFGSDYFGDSEEIKKGGSISAGSFYATQKTSASFLKKYAEKFNDTTAISYAANMYDFATLAFALFKDTSRKLSGQDIVSRFEIPTPINGASGEFYFVKEDASKLKNPGKRFIFPIVIKEIQPDGTSKEVSS